MRYLPKKVRSGRFLGCVAVGAIVLGGLAVVALAAYPQDNVNVYTGCLSTNGSAGNIGSVAAGNSPAKPCSSNEMLIHFSGGTITKVTAGTGLTGGGSDGFVTVGVDPKFQLPQTGCSSGQFVTSDGAGRWSCEGQKTYGGSDFALSNQSCGAGQFLTGFDSAGAKQCANDQTLPQSCTSGQVLTSNGDNTWSCKSVAGKFSSYRMYSGTFDIGGFDFGDTESAYVYCNYPDIATGGGFYNDNTDIQASDPAYSGGASGWYVQAHTGAFASGHFGSYAQCLHVG